MHRLEGKNVIQGAPSWFPGTQERLWKNSHFGATCQSSPWLGRISRNRLGPRETEQDDDLLLRDLGSQLLLCPGSSWWDGSSSRAQPGGSPGVGRVTAAEVTEGHPRPVPIPGKVRREMLSAHSFQELPPDGAPANFLGFERI